MPHVSLDEIEQATHRALVRHGARSEVADHVVVNNSDLTALTAQVDNLWTALTG